MPAACDIQAILTDNPCLAQMPSKELQIFKVAILCSIIDKLNSGPGIDCSDIQAVLDDNPCLFALFPNQLIALEAALVCEINSLL